MGGLEVKRYILTNATVWKEAKKIKQKRKLS